MWRFLALAALVASVTAPPVGAGGSALPTSAFGYAVFGLEEVTIGGGAVVTGNPVGVNVGTLTVRPHARLAAAAAAQIAVGGGVRIGKAYCQSIDGHTSVQCLAVALPLVDPGTLGLVQVLPGAASVDAKRGDTLAPLPPGSYGDATLGGGARLTLTGGVYQFRSLALKPHARLLCQADCTVAVRDAVTVRGGATLGPATKGGAGRVALNLQATGRALDLGPHARLTGVAYAPSGAIRVGGGGRIDGSLVARAIELRPHVRVQGTPTAP